MLRRCEQRCGVAVSATRWVDAATRRNQCTGFVHCADGAIRSLYCRVFHIDTNQFVLQTSRRNGEEQRQHQQRRHGHFAFGRRFLDRKFQRVDGEQWTGVKWKHGSGKVWDLGTRRRLCFRFCWRDGASRLPGTGVDLKSSSSIVQSLNQKCYENLTTW